MVALAQQKGRQVSLCLAPHCSPVEEEQDRKQRLDELVQVHLQLDVEAKHVDFSAVAPGGKYEPKGIVHAGEVCGPRRTWRALVVWATSPRD